MDAPGTLHAASNAALVSGEYVRLVHRTAYLGVSESLSIVSTIMIGGHNGARAHPNQQGDLAGRLRSNLVPFCRIASGRGQGRSSENRHFVGQFVNH